MDPERFHLVITSDHVRTPHPPGGAQPRVAVDTDFVDDRLRGGRYGATAEFSSDREPAGCSRADR